jgi:hypothetical protein
LEEAEVDDDEDEDDEPEDGYEDLVGDQRDSNYISEDGPTAADIEGRRRRMEMWK